MIFNMKTVDQSSHRFHKPCEWNEVDLILTLACEDAKTKACANIQSSSVTKALPILLHCIHECSIFMMQCNGMGHAWFTKASQWYKVHFVPSEWNEADLVSLLCKDMQNQKHAQTKWRNRMCVCFLLMYCYDEQ